MRRSWGLLVVSISGLAASASCGDDGDSLTCDFLNGPDNCFREQIADLYACMGMEMRPDPMAPDMMNMKYYIEGDFVSTSECVDRHGGGKRVVFDPPIEYSNLPGIVYDSSFTMYKGTTNCGSMSRNTAMGTLKLTTEKGEVFYEQGPNEQALTCPATGKRLAGDLKAQECYPARPHGNGTHEAGTASLRMFPSELGDLFPGTAFTFRCSVPSSITGGAPVTITGPVVRAQ